MRTSAIPYFVLAGAIALACAALPIAFARADGAQSATQSSAQSSSQNNGQKAPQIQVQKGRSTGLCMYDAASSIRPHKNDLDPARNLPRMAEDPYGFSATSVTALDLIRTAYGVNRDSIAGGADWLGTERFDVDVKMHDSTYLCTRRAMLQGFVQQSFKLKMHVETRDVPGYFLVVAKGGSKLEQIAVPGDSNPPWIARDTESPQCSQVEGGAIAVFGCHAVTIERVRSMIETFMQRPVIDATQLTAHYNFMLVFRTELVPTPPETPPPHMLPGSKDEPASGAYPLAMALQEELGLQLESTTIPGKVIVIDHIERPTAN